MSRQSRRRFLAAAGTSLGLGGLAGCATRLPGRSPPSPQSDDASTPTEADAAENAPADAVDGQGTPAAPARVDERTDEFVGHLAAEAFDRAAGMFGGVLAGVDAGRLAATWRGLTIQHGSAEGHTIVGRQVQGDRSLRTVDLAFRAGTQRLALVFGPYARIRGLDFPTRPVRPSTAGSGREVDVVLRRDGDGGCPLGATITLPSGDGVTPGVVIAHRAGPHDRDGSVGPNRPYRDLAAGLATRGVASIRYDKRSLVCDLARDEQSLDNVVVADAVTAVRRLAAVESVSAVVVFGHGMGGVAAPLVAREANVAGLVLAATPTRPLSTVFLDTERRKAAADGEITFEERQRLDFVGEQLNGTADLGPDDDYYVLGTATRFWRDLHAHDVVTAVRARSEPAVALHPGRGFVTTEADRRTWRATLPDGGVRVYPVLDHLFMRVFAPSLPEAYFFPDTVARRVVDDVAAWVVAVAG